MRVLYLAFIGNQLLVKGHQKGTDAKGTNGCKFEALRFRFKNDRSGCKDIQVKRWQKNIIEQKERNYFQLGENVDLQKVDSYKEVNDVLGKLSIVINFQLKSEFVSDTFFV